MPAREREAVASPPPTRSRSGRQVRGPISTADGRVVFSSARPPIARRRGATTRCRCRDRPRGRRRAAPSRGTGCPPASAEPAALDRGLQAGVRAGAVDQHGDFEREVRRIHQHTGGGEQGHPRLARRSGRREVDVHVGARPADRRVGQVQPGAQHGVGAGPKHESGATAEVGVGRQAQRDRGGEGYAHSRRCVSVRRNAYPAVRRGRRGRWQAEDGQADLPATARRPTPAAGGAAGVAAARPAGTRRGCATAGWPAGRGGAHRTRHVAGRHRGWSRERRSRTSPCPSRRSPGAAPTDR